MTARGAGPEAAQQQNLIFETCCWAVQPKCVCVRVRIPVMQQLYMAENSREKNRPQGWHTPSHWSLTASLVNHRHPWAHTYGRRWISLSSAPSIWKHSEFGGSMWTLTLPGWQLLCDGGELSDTWALSKLKEKSGKNPQNPSSKLLYDAPYTMLHNEVLLLVCSASLIFSKQSVMRF